MALPADEVPFEGDDVVADYIEKYSNWGRWGGNDELGTLNHVGPEPSRRRSTIGPPGQGHPTTMPYNLRGPQTGDIRANPLNVMTATGTDYMMGAQNELPGGFGYAKGFGYADDVLLMPNQAGSQWDALAHIFWRGRMYNGYPRGRGHRPRCPQRCGIEKHRETFLRHARCAARRGSPPRGRQSRARPTRSLPMISTEPPSRRASRCAREIA